MPHLPTAVIRATLFPLALVACASAGVTPLTQDRTLITAPELRATGSAHVYEAVQHLHPEYLRTRGPSTIMNGSTMGPAVFVDHSLMGGVEVLADMPLNDVQRIQFVSAWDAATRFGEGYSNGVIEITTRRGGQ
jgi:hypothetical protein